LSYRPALTVSRGKVYSNRALGEPVLASSCIRKRTIVLDSGLNQRRGDRLRILLHELFHFAWVRLGNPARASFERMIVRELSLGARGELGWSAQSRKTRLEGPRLPEPRQRLWRDYLCESFCDTAAWLYSGLPRHSEFTLARGHRARRAQWFRDVFSGRRIPI
jgi:hypothetical protein